MLLFSKSDYLFSSRGRLKVHGVYITVGNVTYYSCFDHIKTSNLSEFFGASVKYKFPTCVCTDIIHSVPVSALFDEVTEFGRPSLSRYSLMIRDPNSENWMGHTAICLHTPLKDVYVDITPPSSKYRFFKHQNEIAVRNADAFPELNAKLHRLKIQGYFDDLPF